MNWGIIKDKIQKGKLKIPLYGKLSFDGGDNRIIDYDIDNECTALEYIVIANKNRFMIKGKDIIYITISIFMLYLMYLTVWVIPITIKKNSSVDIGDITAIVIMLLTFGLLASTWKYANLTSKMLSEMRESRIHGAEPQVSIYLSPYLSLPEDKELIDNYYSKIIIRNVGQVSIIDPVLHFEYYAERGHLPRVSANAVCDEERNGAIKAQEEIILNWDCFKINIEAYCNNHEKEHPFTILRLRFRDAFGQQYSLTQDYDLVEGLNPPHLSLQCEFISSPSGYRWRLAKGKLGIWVPGIIQTTFRLPLPRNNGQAFFG